MTKCQNQKRTKQKTIEASRDAEIRLKGKNSDLVLFTLNDLHATQAF